MAHALSCSAGGKSGDDRTFAACLVGDAGMALFDFYFAATQVHNVTRENLIAYTNRDEKYLPTIRKRTPDIIECASVAVIRR